VKQGSTPSQEVLMPIKMSTSPGGRPADSGILPTGELAEKLANDGQIQPLEVMYANMRFYAQQAEMLSMKLQAFALREKPPGGRRYYLELLRLMQTVTRLRERAQACAVDMMPYVHPKLKANPIDSDAGERPIIVFESEEERF
jgi:hypothetical protein